MTACEWESTLQMHANNDVQLRWISHSAAEDMAGVELPHAEVNILMSPSMDVTDVRDCQTSHNSVVVDMSEDAADQCFNEELVHPWFGHHCCWFTTILRTVCFFVFMPFMLVQVLLQISGIYKACVTQCGITCFSDVWAFFGFEYKSTVEFDYTHRTVILRMFRRFCCLCSYRLLREQRLPFESIKGFKFGPFIDSSSVPMHWKRSGHLVLVAVKRPLGEAKDGFLAQPQPSGCCSYCCYSSSENFSKISESSGYTWPAFIRRKLMNDGDLLVLDYKSRHSMWNVDDDCDPYKIRACRMTPRKLVTPLSPKTVEEMLDPIVNRLNECLVAYR
jgi:hypothetical protein